MGKLCFSAMAGVVPGGGQAVADLITVLCLFCLAGGCGTGLVGEGGHHTTLLASSLARPCCTQALWGMGRDLPSSSGISPWRLWVDIWSSSKTSSLWESGSLIASAVRAQQAPAPSAPTAVSARLLVCEGCTFLCTSKVQFLLGRRITEPSGSG